MSKPLACRKQKPIVGLRLYRLNIGNNARHVPQALTPVLVTKCGRKYFTVARNDGPYPCESRHMVDGWAQENGGYSANYALYESEQEWADERDHTQLTAKLRAAFAHGSECFPLDVLKAVETILWPNAEAQRPAVAGTLPPFVGGEDHA